MSAIHANLTVSSAVARLRNADGKAFYVRISEDGLEFYARSSTRRPDGNLSDAPVTLSGPQIFDMIRNLQAGTKKFGEKAAFEN